MIKPLLVSLSLSTALAAGAVSPQPQVARIDAQQSYIKTPAKSNVLKTHKLSKAVRYQELGSADLSIKRILAPGASSALVNPRLRTRALSAELPAGTKLAESFENPGEDPAWLPDGWTMESKGSAELTDAEKWGVAQQESPWFPGPSDGDWYAGIGYSMVEQDEWLISPEMTLDGIYQLKFDAYFDPAFFFKMGEENVDWDAYAWIKQEIAFTVQVLVQEKGGEFEVVRDFAQEHMGESLEDLVMSTPSGLETFNVNLAEYAGKDVRIAFRYVGIDGNTVFLDNVRVGLPEMELSFSAPYSTLYYGIGKENWESFSLRIAVFPAFRPITFFNTTYDDALSYTWMYSHPETTEMVPADGDDLEMTYRTDYSSEFTTNNNLYYPPMLTATGEGYSDGSKAFDVDYIQAGGHASFKLSDGEYHQFSLLPFDPQTSKIGIATAEMDFGEVAAAMFGHSETTRKFWTDYTFYGENEEGEYCDIAAIMNYIYPSNSPLVVKGAWLNAVGEVTDDALLTITVHSMTDAYDEEGEWIGQTIDDTPIATATCKGTDVLGRYPGANSYLTVPFEFDSPVALDENISAAYVIKISGFNNDECPFFAPAQSWIPNPDYLCLGWVEKEICMSGVTRTSLNPVAYSENEHGEMYSAFAINLDAWYPWLEADEEEILLGGETTSVALDSYHDASELKIEAPEWIEASAAGRYGEAALNLTAAPNTDGEDREGNVTVSIHGLEKSFKVKQQKSGIVSTTTSAASVKDVFNASGMRVNPDNLTPGVYIITRTDGSVSKRIVK